MDKIIVIYAKFLLDVACQKLSKSVNVSRSYSKNKSGFLFLKHGVDVKGDFKVVFIHVTFLTFLYFPLLFPSSPSASIPHHPLPSHFSPILPFPSLPLSCLLPCHFLPFFPGGVGGILSFLQWLSCVLKWHVLAQPFT